MGKKANLIDSINWDVKETQITIAGTNTQFDDYKGLLRSDNDGQLSIVKNRYSPFTNADLAETAKKLSQITGMEIEGYSEFKEGRRVLAYLKNTDKNFNILGHKCNNFITLGNTHDGSSAVFFGTVDDMLRCENQWGRIVKAIKVRHSKNKDKKIEEVLANFETYMAERRLYYKTLENFGEIKIDKNVITALVNQLLEVQDRTDISTVKKNQIIKLEDSILEETDDLGMNMFGLFNGVTHYTTHKVNAKGGNTYGNIFGKQNDLNNEAYNFGMALIEKRPALVTV